MDFSKYSAKELPKLVPFPDPANIKQQSSIPSCSSSYTSLFTTDTATASESQRAATQPTADSDDDVANIANADNKGESSSSSSDDDEMHEMVSFCTSMWHACVCVCVLGNDHLSGRQRHFAF